MGNNQTALRAAMGEIGLKASAVGLSPDGKSAFVRVSDADAIEEMAADLSARGFHVERFSDPRKLKFSLSTDALPPADRSSPARIEAREQSDVLNLVHDVGLQGFRSASRPENLNKGGDRSQEIVALARKLGLAAFQTEPATTGTTQSEHSPVNRSEEIVALARKLGLAGFSSKS